MNFFRCGGGADTSIVTANAEDVLSQKVIVDADGNPLTGTMTNNGGVSKTLNCGDSYTIPQGYHNGSGKVTVNSLASQTSANATAAQILSGYTAWVNGNKITGNASGRKFASVDLGYAYETPSSGRAQNFRIQSQNVNTGFRPIAVVIYYYYEGRLNSCYFYYVFNGGIGIIVKLGPNTETILTHQNNSSYFNSIVQFKDNGFYYSGDYIYYMISSYDNNNVEETSLDLQNLRRQCYAFG